MSFPFTQVDVFATTPFSGNPLAVVLDARGLDTEVMRSLSAWTNLSECTFVLPPTSEEADYRVRIFSGRMELPFAGHPTLGTAAAWRRSGGVSRRPGTIIQECGIGLVQVREQGDVFSFAAPDLLRDGPVTEQDLGEAAEILGLEPSLIVEARWADNGPGWLGILLPDPEVVASLRPSASPGRSRAIGVLAPTPSGDPDSFVVRSFFSEEGGPLLEDPVTGSFNAAAAQWMLDTGRARTPYSVRQGEQLGRAGRVLLTEEDTGLWVGGTVRTVVQGSIDA